MSKKPKKITLEQILPKYTLTDVIVDDAVIENNEAEIDRRFENLAAYVGRKLTEEEQEAILDIVDECTPKDGKGYYRGPLVPFDYAWKIYENQKESDGKTP